ncbi:MAG: nucleotidyltransferase domain-containing protein [Armatimonadetes bacterium]|nr:nucleotidyltransferase domain-containing protein [Armatimonadota bacterium]
MKLENLKQFCEEHGIELIVLFGSIASGRSHPASDADIAVKLGPGADLSKLDLVYEFNDLYPARSIDLVCLTQNTDPLLLYQIFSMGQLLYEKNPGAFVGEKLRAWKLYIDTQKLRRMQNSYLNRFLKQINHVT